MTLVCAHICTLIHNLLKIKLKVVVSGMPQFLAESPLARVGGGVIHCVGLYPDLQNASHPSALSFVYCFFPHLFLNVLGWEFPVVMYGCESWTIKKAEHRRMDAFEMWCWRRLLRVFWTTKKSNQSILKEISPEYSLEGLMLKLKLKYFGHLMQKN